MTVTFYLVYPKRLDQIVVRTEKIYFWHDILHGPTSEHANPDVILCDFDPCGNVSKLPDAKTYGWTIGHG